MLPMKLDLTEDLASELRHLRLSRPVNGEILTAENLSKALGKNRAWVSQIESRRLKKIKREDIINIYSFFYNISTDEAERLAESLLKKHYSIANPISSTINNVNTTLKQLNIINDNTSATEKEVSYIKNLCAEQIISLCKIFVDLCNTCQTPNDCYDLYELLSSLNTDLTTNYSDTQDILTLLDFSLLSYAIPDEKEKIMNSFYEISDTIDTFEDRALISNFERRINLDSNSLLTDSKICNTLLTALIDLTKIITSEKDINVSLQYLNQFIDVTRNCFERTYPKTPFPITITSNPKFKHNLFSIINELQLLLEDPVRYPSQARFLSKFHK